MDHKTECEACDGEGRWFSDADKFGRAPRCYHCEGTGERDMTADEIADCASETPINRAPNAK